MGPMRVNWSFPYSGQELVERCEQLEAESVAAMSESLTAEQDFEREQAEYRERLRVAGVKHWDVALLDPSSGAYRHSDPNARFREKQQKVNKRLVEIGEFKRQLVHDLERDPERLYKLTIDDIRFFGL